MVLVVSFSVCYGRSNEIRLFVSGEILDDLGFGVCLDNYYDRPKWNFSREERVMDVVFLLDFNAFAR